ncbi:PAP2 family protein [Clostridiales bacterium oral taxon 876 str. F0540]|nr:PAP2 family protein [Clostridiales bacterium oral taxon 876 str. F0540]
MYLDIPSKIINFDNYILVTISKYLKSKYLDRLMPLITSMGNLGAVWILIAVFLLLDTPFSNVGGIIILTLIISTLIGEGIIKHLVRRVRPCVNHNKNELLITKPISYSFPSGHTLSSFAVAKVLSVYFVQYKLLFMAIALLIALSRLYLHVHYPTDVIAGIIIGLICSEIVFIIIEKGYIEKFASLYQNIM